MTNDTLTFAEKMITLLDEGSFNTSYKFAVLMAFLDLSVELYEEDDQEVISIRSDQLAEKALAIYWNQANPFKGDHVLFSGKSGQAEIITLIAKFRALPEYVGRSLRSCDEEQSPSFVKLLREVEWKLVEQPLPRLQWFGNREDRFIYDFNWNKDVTRSEFLSEGFDRRLKFKKGVAENFVRLNGLLRPLIQRKWTAFIASANRAVITDTHLEEFLFGQKRKGLEPVRNPLLALQKNICLYCSHEIRSASEVDHFLPWSRWPSNHIENLVASHPECNGAKRDFFAATGHLSAWMSRNSKQAGELGAAAGQISWESDADRVLKAARGVYSGLPEATQLWVSSREFEGLKKRALVGIWELLGAVE